MISSGQPRAGAYDADPTPFLAMAAIAGAVFLSAPALLVGMLLTPLVRGRRLLFAAAALAGVGFVWLTWDRIDSEMFRAAHAAQRHHGLTDARASFVAAWPHIRAWWLLATPLCFLVASLASLMRRPSVDELRDRQERRQDRARRRSQRRARRRAGVREPSPRVETRFELGQHVEGDRILPVTRGDRVWMPLGRMAKSILVIGAPGSGKTETLRRLAYGVATSSDASIVVIDAKGDPDVQLAFQAAMRVAGRTPRLFPQDAYDGWRGTPREITSRLVALIDWADEGGGAYYRDLSVNLVRLACTAPVGPPGCSGELLERLDKTELIRLWAGRPQGQEAARFKDEQVDACRQRYRSFFDATAGQLDGAWAFEDADSAYVLLNELAYGEETTKLARFLVEDFKQYVATRKARDQRVLLIVDEFSAIADGDRMARTVEVVRSYGAAVVLAPQCLDGMGGPEASARILNAAHTIFLHAVPDPEPIVKAAGTKMATEISLQHDHGQSADVGSSRAQHQHRADPNEVRRLSPGMCVLIGNGQAQTIQIAPVVTTNAADSNEGSRPSLQPSPEAAPPPDLDEPFRL